MEQPAKLKAVIGHSIQHQLAFVGPFGVGKTTALRAVSDIPVANMDVASAEALAAGMDAGGKLTTTIGFDYGEWHFQDGANVGLFGVPGQERFDSIWDALLPRSSGVVLWLYGDRPTGEDDCRFWLDALQKRNAAKRLAAVITRVAADDQYTLDRYRRLVAPVHPYAPVITADPRERMQVMQAILVALSTPFHSGEEANP